MLSETIDYLGRRARDKITNAEGVVTAVSFDTAGCVQCSLNRGLDKDGKPHETYWYDIQRLELLGDERVLPVPSQFQGPPKQVPSAYRHGPTEKAAPRF